MSGLQRTQLFSMEDYLQGEQRESLRHEFVDGHVYAMAGASARHNRICIRTLMALEPMALAKGCQTFMADMKLRVDTSVYYPDVMVICDASDTDPLMKSAPCLIIEVLSESTERADRIEKLQAYQSIKTLRNYLLVAQDARRVELYRRTGNAWQYESFIDQGDIELDCPPGILTLGQIYDEALPSR
jgi:Uma2 family endonuclease